MQVMSTYNLNLFKLAHQHAYHITAATYSRAASQLARGCEISRSRCQFSRFWYHHLAHRENRPKRECSVAVDTVTVAINLKNSP
jgi:hypothetical protein